MADRSKVDIEALASFGMDVGKMLKDYGDGLKDGLSKIGGAVTGFSGTNEAQTFSDYYFKAVLPSSNSFSTDVMKGLLAIHFGAIVQAANYREGDLSQAQAMDDVINEFNPAAGKDGVGAAFDKAQQKDPLATASTDNQAADDNWKLPPPTNTPDNVCVAPSPAEQVRLHEKLYGKDERWRPADPNPPQPQPTLVDPPPPGGWPANPGTTTV
jgi:hypothetical protein